MSRAGPFIPHSQYQVMRGKSLIALSEIPLPGFESPTGSAHRGRANCATAPEPSSLIFPRAQEVREIYSQAVQPHRKPLRTESQNLEGLFFLRVALRF